jgi:TetR/AcrR family transcriptional regulator, cholesterol catabolism regulator
MGRHHRERPGAPSATVQAPGRRAEIVAAAGSLFRDHGYHATSMRDLAKRLNLQGGSLYAHIGSKEELLWEIVDAAAAAFLAAAEAVDPTLPAPERLRGLVHGHLQVVVDELEHATVFFHEWTHLRPDLRRRIVERRDAYQDHFRRAVHDGVRDGSFMVDDADLATLLVLSTLNWSYQWLDPAGRLDLDALTDAYATFLLRALGAKQAVGPPARTGSAPPNGEPVPH